MTEKKLLLFDIDGTLISSGGKGKNAAFAAFVKHCGTFPKIDALKIFAGSTDRKIIRVLLEKCKIVPTEKLIDAILKDYLIELAKIFAKPDPVKVHPGVVKLLERLLQMENCIIGLLTGNIAEGAKIKLAPANLNRFFEFGAFGSDAEDRNLLPPFGIKRAEKITGTKFAPQDVWIIGDTPRDIECAKVNHLKVLAVETGGWDSEDLKAHQPDALFADLADTDAVIKAIFG